MHAFLRSIFLAFFTLARLTPLALLAAPSLAWAEPETKSVVVVDVPDDAPELDAAALRRAIGAELGEDAVAPGDPRAEDATGSIRVSIDRAKRALVVVYRGQAEPITRAIDLPGDRAAVERAAVVLSGNLARDEADELAASLRHPKVPPMAPGPSPQDVAANDDLEKLGRILERQRRATPARRIVGWTLFGAGLTLVVLSPGIRLGGSAGFYAGEGIANSMLFGSAIAQPGRFDELFAAYDARPRSYPQAALDQLEAQWLATATQERRVRIVYGIVSMAMGGVCGTLLAAIDVYGAAHPSSGGIDPTTNLALAALCSQELAAGVYFVARPGPVEGALREYQRAVGRTVHAEDPEIALRPLVLPTVGGAMIGLGGRF